MSVIALGLIFFSQSSGLPIFLGIFGLAAVAGLAVLIWALTKKDDNIKTIQVDEEVEQSTQVRSGSFQPFAGQVARGNLTILSAGSKYTLNVTNFDASECEDLDLYFATAANPTAITGLTVKVDISAQDVEASKFVKDLPEGFDAESTSGYLLYCASSTSALGNGGFSDFVAPDAMKVISSGTFTSLNDYSVKGKISVLQRNEFVSNQPVMRYSLRFEDMDVQEGPDLYLYLTTNESPDDISAPGSIRVLLDGIKNFAKNGNFNQELGADVDGKKFKGANIWCAKFSVAFGKATLSPV